MDSVQRKEEIKTLRLLYEFSENSPLFARIAEEEMIDGNLNKAVELLQNGIRIYPEYPTARILLAKAFALLGERELAYSELEAGCLLFNSNETREFYSAEIEKILSSVNDSPSIPLDEQFSSDEENEEEVDSPKAEEPEIVSETLAGIYRSQGSLDEALAMYKKLLIKYPERKEHFEQIITEVEIEKNNEG